MFQRLRQFKICVIQLVYVLEFSGVVIDMGNDCFEFFSSDIRQKDYQKCTAVELHYMNCII